MQTKRIKVLLIVSLIYLMLLTPTVFIAQTAESPTAIQAVEWSSDGTILAVGGIIEGEAGLWLYDEEGQQISQLQVPANVTSLAWNPNDSKIAASVSGNPDAVYIWDMPIGNAPMIIPQEGATDDTSIKWSPDGDRIATARTASVYIWDITTGELLIEFEHPGRANAVEAFAWHPNGNQVWSAGADSIVRTWDLATANPISEVQFPHLIVSIALSPDGLQGAFGGSDGSVQIRDLSSGENLGEWQIYSSEGPERVVYYLDWDPLGNQLAASGNHGPITILDITAGTAIVQIQRNIEGTLEDIDYSLYGGRLALANNLAAITADSQADASATDTIHQVIANGAVQIIVPAPSLERLQAIADACNVPADVKQLILTTDVVDPLTTFIAQVEALPEGAIPAGCAADLIAVAEAVIAQ